jgi:hypothetical protein
MGRLILALSHFNHKEGDFDEQSEGLKLSVAESPVITTLLAMVRRRWGSFTISIFSYSLNLERSLSIISMLKL